ncbi:MAG: hypothetical protein PHF50_04470 [Patescibacteria group bacterium]|nr:hypothetical protein [Patescibacteria group bacterium]
MQDKIIKNSFFVTTVIITLITSGVFGLVSNPVLASTTDGTISASNKYAWSENANWLDFGLSQGNIHVTDSALTGYAYGENIGWISLNCSNDSSCATANYGVVNDGNGNLSGYAWSENTGWVNFKPTGGGVIINSSGEFTGSAYGENIGWVTFNCSTTSSCSTADYKVATDWRPRSARPQCNNALDDDNDGFIDYPADPGCQSLEGNNESNHPGSVPYFLLNVGSSAPVEKIQEIAAELPKKIEEIKNNAAELIKPLVEAPIAETKKILKKTADSFSPEAKKIALEKKQAEEAKKAVPSETPDALKGDWPLFPEGPVNNFALTPETKELSLLLNKFPDLEKTFLNLGVNKIEDLGKLAGVKLFLPGLTEALGLTGGAGADGGIILTGGIPLNELTREAKAKIPADIVFAKSAGQLVDFNMELTVSKTGETQSKIKVISGRSLSLLVKPESRAKSVTGSIIFKDKTAELKPDKTLAAALRDLAIKPALAETETRMVLNEFNYNDDDKDGVWTADIQTPIVQGKYEIITKINFQDEKLAAKEIRLITVVDPEGYVFRRSGAEETRLSGAIVSIFWLNPSSNSFELWPAEKYQQANPQTTDVTGRYSFLVPQGEYYIKAVLDGYPPYEGKQFTVKEGNNVNFNIELKAIFWNFKTLDWKIILLIILTILILYNFYRDRKRKKVDNKI